MSIRRFVLPALTLAVFAAANLLASAQTGPISGTGKSTGKGSPPAAGGAMNAESLAKILQTKGYKASVQAADNGGKNVVAVIEAGGWKYDVTFALLANGKEMDVFSPLSAPGQTYSKEQLEALLKKNAAWVGGLKYFIIGQKDGKLYLANTNFTMPTSEQQLMQILDGHLAAIRESYDLWKSN